MNTDERFNPLAQRICAWSGIAFVVVFLIGFIPLAHFLPPPAPSDSAQEIADMYRRDKTEIRLGCFLMIVSFAFWLSWGASIAVWTKRMEHGYSALTYGILIGFGCGTAVLVLIPVPWVIAAYRPGDIDVDITQTINDIGWFLFLFTWPPFSVVCVLLALAIFADTSARPIFPRWTAYLNLWCALLLVPAGMIAFFKTGPFAYNGAIAYYIPLFAFLIWMVAMTAVVLRATTNEEKARAAREPAMAR